MSGKAYRCKQCRREWDEQPDGKFAPRDSERTGCWGSGVPMLEGSMGLLIRVGEMEEITDDPR